MIKLFTLENLSPFSSDAVYKICLSLEEYGMTDENIKSFNSYDEMFDGVVYALESGDEIVVAAETADYNSVKRDLISKLILEEYSSPMIAEAIAMADDSDEKAFDMQAHCTIPRDSVCHLSTDGLFSGFSLEALNGRITFVPLDFSRIDSVLGSYISNCLAPANEQYNGDLSGDTAPDYDDPYNFTEPISKMVYSLVQLDRNLSIATSEAAMWIYNFYDKIDGLSEVVNFVEIIDPEEEPEIPEIPTEEPAEADDTAPETEEPADLQLFDSDDEEPLQPVEEEPIEKPEPESASAKTIRHAREAMKNMDADFGAAISEIYTSEDEDGTVNYFAYIAVADKKSAKAKRINTTNPEDADLILPNCVTLLADTVCQKADAVNSSFTGYEPDAKAKNDGQKKLSKNMIIFAAVILLIAIICPIYIVHLVFKDNTNNNQPNTPVVLTGDYTTTSPFDVTTTVPEVTTVADPFGLNSLTSTSDTQNSTANPALPSELQPMEAGVSDITVQTTAPSVSSTKGTFTFYVFGYGHGVGLSQYGANYLASQGWNYAQILANYYYGTVLVSGDTYPEKITYKGQSYETRDLLACVLEGEMGSSFNTEALKAQAVAIYTFAKNRNFKELDENAFAYKSPASQACYAVVDEIMKNGLYIAEYGTSQPALTPFHSISAGVTTSYRNAWNVQEVTYLAGNRPSYGDYNAPNFKTTYTVTSDELKTIIESKSYGITLSGDPATWLSIVSHDSAVNQDVGYVSTINVGGKIMTGNEFRVKIMEGKIRSHCFMIVYTPDQG
ncbi:MAG: hypothetical protein NC122_05500 [Faecalibacterium sp.]|nr:hypothetical protein [Ruminococcus sp.]MCM1392568.1 hypothetical protein [Ruminococcus sp.]MCM1485643.1 hypothetical protein [Faecalibacterium sp.]